ncbi:MAG: response regulator [Desulfatitalea sp.]|nr:response regulator [Desulfatitalea sp.]NNK00629.1 response regulator [Desulfatitalea sp.]
MQLSTHAKPICILMVDDDPADVRLTTEALKSKKVHMVMHTVSDGMEAMAYLRNEGEYARMPRPDLILLDLNMPRMDGRETLGAIKSDPLLKRIPVIILTTSEGEADILGAYDLNASCYITKPVDWHKFIRVVELIEEFWFSIVRLPKE